MDTVVKKKRQKKTPLGEVFFSVFKNLFNCVFVNKVIICSGFIYHLVDQVSNTQREGTTHGVVVYYVLSIFEIDQELIFWVQQVTRL